jgi:hypothetical protein
MEVDGRTGGKEGRKKEVKKIKNNEGRKKKNYLIHLHVQLAEKKAGRQVRRQTGRKGSRKEGRQDGR